MQPSLLATSPPKNEAELRQRCDLIAGLSLGQLASGLGLAIPHQAQQRKGFIGQAVELALGCSAGNLALPDFPDLGIEVKSLPIGNKGLPCETTFVCTIPLMKIQEQQWLSSTCYQKLRSVLWVPVEGDRNLAFAHRRLGQPFLWQPSPSQLKILEQDWLELTEMIVTGQLEALDARYGVYLQVRPKGADGRVLVDAVGAQGQRIQTLPRGFYVRTRLTAEILQSRGFQ